MADTLRLSGIAVECRVGVHDWEQAQPQTIWIDLKIAIDAAAVAAQDDLQAAVDYAGLVAAVKQRAQRMSYRLLETLAEEIAGCVLTQFRVPQVWVRVKKRALPGIAYAAVEITRPRPPDAGVSRAIAAP